MIGQTTPNMLQRILDPVVESLTPQAARRLVELRADPVVQHRMDELADKCTQGLLTEEERNEYETYVLFGNWVALLQARARALLASDRAA